jgi:hypothetical protein
MGINGSKIFASFSFCSTSILSNFFYYNLFFFFNAKLLDFGFAHFMFLFLFFLFHDLNLDLDLSMPLFFFGLQNLVYLVVFVYITTLTLKPMPN